jgi:hypothetical protein
MMQRYLLKSLGVLLAMILAPPSFAQPDYASDETKRVIEAMVEAHGGMERWQAAPSIRFDDIMYMPFHDREQFAWWAAHEVIDQKTRQVWQNWPMDDAMIGYDGEQVWSTNWNKGNPSASMVHFFYYFVNLPWLSQDDGVILSEVKRFDWPELGDGLYEIEMRFAAAPGIGKSSNGYFVLYIDPETYRLVGYQYANGYQPLLDVMNMPEGKKVFGPMWRQITRYEEVGGLLFATAFRTMPGPGKKIVGSHLIMNIDISQPFEYDRAKAPKDAVIFDGPLRTE